MKALRKRILGFVAGIVLAGFGFAGYRNWFAKSSKSLEAVATEALLSAPEDEGFRECPDDAEAQMASNSVEKHQDTSCIPALLPFEQPFGPLHLSMSIASLQAECGQVLTDFLFYLGEGQCQWGTALYRGTNFEVRIAWRNWEGKKSPAFVHFVGSALHFEDGFGPGMLLEDVARLNGAAVSLGGFGWSASGLHRSFQGGSLRRFDESGADKYQIRYGLDWDLLESASDEENASIITGEALIESTVPALKKFKAKVDSIEYVFSPHTADP